MDQLHLHVARSLAQSALGFVTTDDDKIGIPDTPRPPQTVNDALARRLQILIASMSPFGALVVFSTIIGFMVVMFVVHYTLFSVIPTLAMVEDVQPTATESLARYNDEPQERYTDDDDEIEGIMNEATAPSIAPTDSTPYVFTDKPVTTTLRSAITHLRSIGGWRSCLRGAWLAVVYSLVLTILTGLLGTLLSPIEIWRNRFNFPLAGMIASVLAAVVLAGLNTTWTHLILTEPSARPWFRRVVSYGTYRKILLPTLYTAAAAQIPAMVLAIFSQVLGLTHPDAAKDENAGKTVGKLIGLMVIVLPLVILIVVPTSVALVRVQASLISDQDNAIVPFDRTFGGKTASRSEGVSGAALGYRDALRTFGRSAWLRLAKLVAKGFVIAVVLWVAFVGVLAVEMVVLTNGKAGDGQDV